MDHLIGSTMVSGASMDEDTGDIAVLASSLTRTSEHGVRDRRGQQGMTSHSWIQRRFLKRSGRASATVILNSSR